MPARRKRKAKKTSYSPFGTPRKQKKGGQARKQQEARQKSQVPERSPAQWEKEKQQRVAERRAIQNVAGKWCGHLKIRLLHTEVKQLKGAHDAFWIANRRPLTPLSCCVAIIESPVLFVIEFHFSGVRSGATLEHWRHANFSSEFLLKHVPEASCVIAGPHPDAPTDLKQKKKIRVPALEFLTAIPQPVSCTAPDLLDFFDERLRRAARRGEVRGLRSRGVSFPADDEREWRMAVRVSYSTDNQVHWHTELCVVATDDESTVFGMNDEAASRLTEVEYGCVLKEIHAERERVAGCWRPLARIAAPDTRCDITVQELVDLLKEGLHKLEDVMVRVILPPEFITGDFGRRVRKKCTVSDDSPRKPSFLTKDSILRFQVGLAVDGELLTQEELQELATLREPLIRIRGKWLYLDAAVRGELEKIAQNVLKQSMRTISARQAVGELLRDELREAAGANAILSDVTIQTEGLCILLDAFRSQTPPEVARPQGLDADLRPYQAAGMNWLVMLGDFGIGGCLADDMGLGKTVQTLAWLLHQRQNGISAPALLICPTSVMCNWEKEAQKFAPSLNVIRHHGPNRPGNVGEFSARTRSADLVVTSFSLLSRDRNLFRNVTRQWSVIILDEAQNIKNPNTAVSKAACDLSVSGATRLALTGTPVENGPRDLWPIMEFLNPGMLGTLSEYDKNIASPIEHGKDSDHRQRLKEKIKPFILRRVKTDPGIAPDLPPKIEQIVWCTLTREQAAWYQAALNNMRSALKSRDARERQGAILKVLLQLKLACNGVASLQKDRSDIYSRSGKIERLADMLASVVVNGEKALVFSQYPSQFEKLRDLLMQRLASELDRPVDVLTITGDDSVAAREETQRLFAESEKVSVILISLKAGGTGLNLQSATHVFHLDRWWNAAVEDQATDRAWRIGQTQTVFAYKLVCRGTLEERIDALIAKRRELAGDLLGDSNEESVIKELMKLDGEALQGILELAEDEALNDDAEATGDEEQFEIDRTAGFSV